LTAFDTLRGELNAFSEELMKKERVLIGTKLDLEETTGRLDELRAKYPDERVFGISVFSGEGLAEVSRSFADLVNELEAAETTKT
jgi:GTP-binding protein